MSDVELSVAERVLVVFFSIFAALLGCVLFVLTKRNKLLEFDKSGTSTDLSNLRHRLDIYLHTSSSGRMLDFFQVVLSLVACAVYVGDTYSDDTSAGTIIVELIFNGFFAFDFILQFYSTARRMRFLVSMHSVIDLVTILPVWVLLLANTGDSILRPFRVFRALRVLRAYRLISFSGSGVTRQVTTIGLTVLSLVFISSGVIQVIESDQDLPFHRALYFIIVTITTVGYGDIQPSSDGGRMMIMCMIVCTAVILPMQTGRLISLLNARSKYAGEFVGGMFPHSILTGSLTTKGVSDFLSEFYHPDKYDNDHARIVLLGEDEPTPEMALLLMNPKYEKRVVWLQGSALLEGDLLRVDVLHASTVFVMADKYACDVEAEDSKNILETLSVKNLCPSVPVYVQIMRQSNIHHLLRRKYSSRINVMCVEELKMGVLAKSTLCPGFATLMKNLVHTYTPLQSDRVEAEWKTEYYHGTSNEIYEVTLSEAFNGKRFAEAAVAIYNTYGGVLFAIEVSFGHSAHSARSIQVYPGQGFLLREGMSAYIIAGSSMIRYQVHNMTAAMFQAAQPTRRKRDKHGRSRRGSSAAQLRAKAAHGAADEGVSASALAKALAEGKHGEVEMARMDGADGGGGVAARPPTEEGMGLRRMLRSGSVASLKDKILSPFRRKSEAPAEMLFEIDGSSTGSLSDREDDLADMLPADAMTPVPDAGLDSGVYAGMHASHGSSDGGGGGGDSDGGAACGSDREDDGAHHEAHHEAHHATRPPRPPPHSSPPRAVDDVDAAYRDAPAGGQAGRRRRSRASSQVIRDDSEVMDGAGSGAEMGLAGLDDAAAAAAAASSVLPDVALTVDPGAPASPSTTPPRTSPTAPTARNILTNNAADAGSGLRKRNVSSGSGDGDELQGSVASAGKADSPHGDFVSQMLRKRSATSNRMSVARTLESAHSSSGSSGGGGMSLTSKSLALHRQRTRAKRSILSPLAMRKHRRLGPFLHTTDSFHELIHPDELVQKPRCVLLPSRALLEENTCLSMFDMRDHVVISGNLTGLRLFVSQLRVRGRKHAPPVIILNPTPPTPEEWSTVDQFPDVYYVRGSAKSLRDLTNAGVHGAQAVVLLPTIGNKRIDAHVDAPVIFSVRGMFAAQVEAFTIVELVFMSNTKFVLTGAEDEEVIHETRSRHSVDVASSRASMAASSHTSMQAQVEVDEVIDSIEFHPAIAAGRISTVSMMDSLLSLAYTMPKLVQLLCDLIVVPVDYVHGDHVLQQCHVYSVPVPGSFRDRRYGELFMFLLIRKGMLPLGLYRHPEASQVSTTPLPYVFTNPPRMAELHPGDSVFVLAPEEPRPEDVEDDGTFW